jgi:phosphatidate cytidylyltransferase
MMCVVEIGREPSYTHRMLRWRLLFGVLFIAALVLWCWLDANVARPGAFLVVLALMVSWIGTQEVLDMLNKRGRYPQPWVVYTGVLLTVLLSAMPVFWPEAANLPSIGRLGWLTVGIITGLLLSLIGELRRYGGHWHSTLNLGLAMFVICYVGGLMGLIVQLRLLDDTASSGRTGMFALASFIAIVKMSDTGQYAVGRLIGRHKLAPVVSPGKTWEGAVGGLVFAIGTAWFVFGWVTRHWMSGVSNLPPLTESVDGIIRLVIFAAALAAAGLLGDLAESMLKRDAEVKDSSTWLPGFGGVLDLLDSLLGAAPVAFLFWACGIVRI